MMRVGVVGVVKKNAGIWQLQVIIVCMIGRKGGRMGGGGGGILQLTINAV